MTACCYAPGAQVLAAQVLVAPVLVDLVPVVLLAVPRAEQQARPVELPVQPAEPLAGRQAEQPARPVELPARQVERPVELPARQVELLAERQEQPAVPQALRPARRQELLELRAQRERLPVRQPVPRPADPLRARRRAVRPVHQPAAALRLELAPVVARQQAPRARLEQPPRMDRPAQPARLLLLAAETPAARRWAPPVTPAASATRLRHRRLALTA